MSKFKVGDIVRLKEQGSFGKHWDGDRKVTKVDDNYTWISHAEMQPGGFYEHQLELVKTDSTYAVWNYRTERFDLIQKTYVECENYINKASVNIQNPLFAIIKREKIFGKIVKTIERFGEISIEELNRQLT